MKVSVITAVYNREKTIGDAIDSLYKQTYQNFEQIIVDGLSKDRTVEIIKYRSDLRTLIKSEEDRGIYDAFNKGLLRSTGDIIGFLHSDDFYSDEEILSEVVRAFQTSGCDLVYGDLDYVSEADTSKIIRNWISGGFEFKKLKYGWMPPHPTVFVRRELVKDIGLFDLNYRIAADYDYMLRCLKKRNIKVCYLPKKIMKMRVGGASNGSLRFIIKKSLEDYSIIKKNMIFLIFPLLTLVMKNFRKLNQFKVAN
ncbi:glycosyltransferase [Polynucleobacter sp. MWH-Loch1C5]|uniref:glycosyltransferase family 2 protein n=1 Tax=Polynucleobacter sp. MWH-Loch1C5 TaxID=2689108 RepID=UPI001C0B3EF8|nr:glycosyltransferase family 2 protein [Polynucleobacter sp. MWH-Loch1C5]MBU3542215.1 glycosyltransferase [Polynucleobacter sp. MWH-Loch1C5]